MLDSTRDAAKARIQAIQNEIQIVWETCEAGHTALVLEKVVHLRGELNELAVFLLICHLRAQFDARQAVTDEQIVEETRATLARFFDIL